MLGGSFLALPQPLSHPCFRGLPRTSGLKGFEKPWTRLVGDRKATKASRGWSKGPGLHASSHTVVAIPLQATVTRRPENLGQGNLGRKGRGGR